MKTPHTLTLKSYKLVDRGSTRVMLFLGDCSCGWKSDHGTATTIRGEHSAHLQHHLGPEAHEARERAL